MAERLESEHGEKVVRTSHWLAGRPFLAGDPEAMPGPDALLVEHRRRRAPAVRAALDRVSEGTFFDKRLVSTGGDGRSDELGLATVAVVIERFAGAAIT